MREPAHVSSSTDPMAAIVSRAPADTERPLGPSSRGTRASCKLTLTSLVVGTCRAMRSIGRRITPGVLKPDPMSIRSSRSFDFSRNERLVEPDRRSVGVGRDHAVVSRDKSIAARMRWAKSIDEARGWLVRWTSSAHRASSTWRTSARAFWNDVACRAN